VIVKEDSEHKKSPNGSDVFRVWGDGVSHTIVNLAEEGNTGHGISIFLLLNNELLLSELRGVVNQSRMGEFWGFRGNKSVIYIDCVDRVILKDGKGGLRVNVLIVHSVWNVA